MDIKDKFRPLQFKNVNASLSNKESIQTDCKAIKLLKKKKKVKLKLLVYKISIAVMIVIIIKILILNKMDKLIWKNILIFLHSY